MQDDWPDHATELSRKVSVQVDRWMKLYESSRISKREFFLIVTALYDATSGLLKPELRDLLAKIEKELRLG